MTGVGEKAETGRRRVKSRIFLKSGADAKAAFKVTQDDVIDVHWRRGGRDVWDSVTSSN